ncbi:MAG TPA: hypothetical protein VGX52_07265 [Burkholderiales bacterium]|nr:hypothetical protein [Burkholderiales bacterium]
MRKQVYDLTAADLEAHPVWEHCLDEEGLPNQDEATVRPYDTAGKPVPFDAGLLVVRTTLTLANGTRYPGYLYYTPEPPAQAGPGYGPLANLQPQITTPEGQVMFWYGMLRPTPDVMAKAYRLLGADAAGVFPVRYTSDVPLATGPISGELAGFYYLVDKRKGWFSRERVVERIS